jgi:hypothetical protein|uniref:C2H2-type domain-containing protein n=1 Tax=viral metagenome TaxID=1070528 RepID=A0A6C0IB22_9ZZZZ
MPEHNCESCNYKTNYGWAYERHLKSNKHIKNQTLVVKPMIVMRYSCKLCSKKYQTSSGLWKHSQSCIKEEPPQPTQPPLENTVLTTALLETINKLNTRLETLESLGTVNIVNNNNNVNIYLNYLDTHCNKAINLSQFLETIEFMKEDFEEICKKRFYAQGANAILRRKIECLPIEERPLHCAQPIVNKPTPFLIRDKDTWKTECPALIEYMLKYGDEDMNEPMLMVEFLEKYNSKLYDAFTEMIKTDQKFKKIQNEMNISGQSLTHINMLREMSDMLVLDTP